MANQNSIISYVPQPYLVAGASSIVAGAGVSSIENEDGVFDPDLSNFTTINATSGATSISFTLTFAKSSGHLSDFDMTLALIGCGLLTYESGDPDTEFSENIDCLMTTDIGTVVAQQAGFAHNSQDNIKTFGGSATQSILSGGRANLVFHGLGKSSASSTGSVTVTITRAAADAAARPVANFIIGHLLPCVDMSVVIDPNSFAWTLKVENERFLARDFGAISSDGTLVKRSSGEIIKIPITTMIGANVSGVGPLAVDPSANIFDLVKANTSYPLLFNPYPVGPVAASGVTAEQLNYTARQNFFSIYGFLEDPMELLVSEYREGLNSEYRARYRIMETR